MSHAAPAGDAAPFVVEPAHPALPGHFPGHPIVPGVVLLDRVSAAIEALHGAAPLRWPQVKFLQPLLPGQPAQVELQPVDATGGACASPPRWRFRVLRTADGAVLASGEAAGA